MDTTRPQSDSPPPTVPPPSRSGDGEPLAGRYRLLTELGGGGQAVVWRAFDEVFHKVVAVKVYAGFDAQPGDAAFAEARRLTSVKHPNIVEAFDAGPCLWEGRPAAYVAMEEIQGAVQLHRYCELRAVGLGRTCRIFAAVADALHAIHLAGHVHCDVKPENILVSPRGDVRLTDLGVAALLGARGAHGGTPGYIAPELLASAAGTLTPQTDLFSLGQSMRRVLRPADLAACEDLRRLVDALAAAPDLRPRTAAEVAQRLTALADALGPDPSPRPRTRRASLWTIPAAIALALTPLADIGRGLDRWTEFSCVQFRYLIEHVPRFGAPGRWERTRCVVLEDGDDVKRIAQQLGVPEPDPSNPETFRLIHASVARKLAKAGVVAIAWDICMDAEMPGDRTVRDVIGTLGVPVVLATRAYELQSVRSLGSGKRPVATAYSDLPRGVPKVQTGPPLCVAMATALQGTRGSPSFVLLAALVAGGMTSEDVRGATCNTVGLPPGVACGAKFFPAFLIGPATPDPPELPDAAHVLQAKLLLEVPPAAAVAADTVNYSTVLAMTQLQLREEFANKIIVLANARGAERFDKSRTLETEPFYFLSDGRKVFGFQLNACAIDEMDRDRGPRALPSFPIPLAGVHAGVQGQMAVELAATGVGAWCALAMSARRRTLRSIAALSILPLLALLAWVGAGYLVNLIPVAFLLVVGYLVVPLYLAARVNLQKFKLLWSPE